MLPAASRPINLERCRYNSAVCIYAKQRHFHDGRYGNVAGNTNVCHGPHQCYHAHGMTWSSDPSDPNNARKSELFAFISDQDHYQARGYFGGLPGFPPCGCIEDMPMIRRADCTMVGENGQFVECQGANGQNNDLRTRIELVGQQTQVFDFSLVNQCPQAIVDTTVNPAQAFGPKKRQRIDVSAFDFGRCRYRAIICAFIKKEQIQDNGEFANVDSNTVQCFGSQLPVHAHGFAVGPTATEEDMAALLDYVANTDHGDQRNYFGALDGSPLACSCAEEQVTVTRSDCTMRNASGEFVPCDGATGNDLRSYIETHLVQQIELFQYNLLNVCPNENHRNPPPVIEPVEVEAPVEVVEAPMQMDVDAQTPALLAEVAANVTVTAGTNEPLELTMQQQVEVQQEEAAAPIELYNEMAPVLVGTVADEANATNVVEAVAYATDELPYIEIPTNEDIANFSAPLEFTTSTTVQFSEPTALQAPVMEIAAPVPTDVPSYGGPPVPSDGVHVPTCRQRKN